jgi:hypothetical protein
MRKSLFTILGPTALNYDLTTVDAVNLALGITGNTAVDAIMAENITRASRMIGELCDRTFALLTVSESFRMSFYDPVRGLNLRQFPVTQFDSITVGGQSVDAGQYELDMDAGILWLVSGSWAWSYYSPANSHWAGEAIVQYSGGYDLPDEAPALLSQACIETLRSQRFNSNRDPAIRSTTHGDTTVSYGDYFNRFRLTAAAQGAAPESLVLPPNANDMIQQYKRLIV